MADTTPTDFTDILEASASADFPRRIADTLAEHNVLLWAGGPLPFGWSGGTVADDHLLVALNGSIVYVMATWTEPGTWRDRRDVWRDAGGRCLPSPVLAADAAANALVKRFNAAIPPNHPFDVHAIVLVHPDATLPVDDTDAEALWSEWRVDVFSLAGGDWPTLGGLLQFDGHAPPDPALVAVLDAGQPLSSAEEDQPAAGASTSVATNVMFADTAMHPGPMRCLYNRVRQKDRSAGEAVGRVLGISGLCLACSAVLAFAVLACTA